MTYKDKSKRPVIAVIVIIFLLCIIAVAFLPLDFSQAYKEWYNLDWQ